MTELQQLFFQRIGIPPIDPVTFNDISKIQHAMAQAVPFENMDIVESRMREVSRENLRDKILVNGRGGLCYELNPMMYYFLRDCGMDVHLVAGTVFKNDTGTWTAENGHITTVLTQEGARFIVDVGFGSYLALAPVPFGGDVVHSPAGDFRVIERATEKGTHVLEMRKTNGFIHGETSPEWQIGYAFRLPPVDEVQLNKTQKLTAESEDSPFTKGPIVVKLTETGHISLTTDSFTVTTSGEKEKREISPAEFDEIMAAKFRLEKR